MANTLLTPEVIADQALATLYESTVLAQLVHRDYEPEFARRVGDAISIRKPPVFEAREYVRATGIQIQDATEGSIPMTLNHFKDVSFAVTSEELTLKIEDFDETFLTPAMEAMAQAIDRDLIAQAYADITQEVGGADENADGEDYNGYQGDYPWSDSRVLIQAGTVLSRNKVPLTRRRVVTGPETAGRWVAEKTWRQTDHRGSTEGLLEASLGARVAGFDPYMTQNVPSPAGTPTTGQPTTEVGIAFHETALALAIRPLELPRGAEGRAAIRNYKGLGLRVVYGYDLNKKQDVVSIDCLYGTKTIAPERAVLIKGADQP